MGGLESEKKLAHVVVLVIFYFQTILETLTLKNASGLYAAFFMA